MPAPISGETVAAVAAGPALNQMLGAVLPRSVVDQLSQIRRQQRRVEILRQRIGPNVLPRRGRRRGQMTGQRLRQHQRQQLHRLPRRRRRDPIGAEPLPRDPHLHPMPRRGGHEPARRRPVVLDVVPGRRPALRGHQQPVRLRRRHCRELPGQHDPGRPVMRRRVQQVDQGRLLPASAQDRSYRRTGIIHPHAGLDVEPQGRDLRQLPRRRSTHRSPRRDSIRRDHGRTGDHDARLLVRT